MNDLRLGMVDAAHVIGVSKRVVEHWLQRCVTLPGVQAGRGERLTFGDHDLCFLVLMVQINRFGASAKVANNLAQAVFEMARAEPSDDDPLAAWHGKYIRVIHTTTDWEITLFASGTWAPTKLLSLVVDPVLLFSDVLHRADAIRRSKVA
jgi:hypothetical protein